ncbi:hypothetical protein [uncultured Chryseobacterium sp.]|uniref:hypothetical protein n=1 Tax=uncultured Chryseobacterium sp. TaxID=259322 RepID=UPI0025DC136B|nr:hypothetical protein [uncultured Chryseobacterium sp.]
MIRITNTAKVAYPFFRNKHIHIRKDYFPVTQGGLFPAIFTSLPEDIASAVAPKFRLRPVFTEVFYNIPVINGIVDEWQ